MTVTTAAPWDVGAGTRVALDATIEGALTHGAGSIARTALHTAHGGKRLRAAITIAAAGQHAAERVPPRVLTAATAIELLHWASLVHDDVIDGSDERHGRATVRAAQGTGAAVVVGDYLLGTVFRLGSALGPFVSGVLADTLTSLCVGETRQAESQWNPDVDEADVLAVCAAKTGALLSAAATVGAASVDADDDVVAALGEFGTAFGVCLQLIDDLLDVTSTAARLGKPVGADLAAGVMTMPVVVALRRAPQLRSVLSPECADIDRARALLVIRAPETVRYCWDRAQSVALSAQDTLLAAAGSSTSLRSLARWPLAYVHRMRDTKMDATIARLLRAPADVSA